MAQIHKWFTKQRLAGGRILPGTPSKYYNGKALEVLSLAVFVCFFYSFVCCLYAMALSCKSKKKKINKMVVFLQKMNYTLDCIKYRKRSRKPTHYFAIWQRVRFFVPSC